MTWDDGMTNREEWFLIDKAKLSELYHVKTTQQIADFYGVTRGAVEYRLRSFGLKSTASGTRKTSGPKKSFNPDPKEFAELYKKMSMRDIATHFGVGETVIFHRAKEFGLPFISRAERLTGKKKSAEHIENHRKALIGVASGDKNPNWKGGISSDNKRGRSTSEHRLWRESVLLNANYKCEYCGVEQGSRCECCGHTIHLHAHHKIHFSKDKTLRYDVSNGMALCEKCHHLEHYKQIG